MTGVLYLSDADAERHAPDPATAVELAAAALRAIARGDAVLGHELLRLEPGSPVAVSSIRGMLRRPPGIGIKWVAESPAGVQATILLNDPETGLLTTVLGATFLTGLRTAAVSGACIAELGANGPVALVGTGLQARTHLAVLEALGRHEVRVAYRRRESADALLAWAAENTPKVRIDAAADVRAAVEGAPVVVTMVTRGSFAPVAPDWLRDDALVLPVDFAHCIGADVAATAELLAADDPQNYDRVRTDGELPGYPEARIATGAALDGLRPRGRIVIQNMGNAAGDLLIATATRDAALAAGAGTLLER